MQKRLETVMDLAPAVAILTLASTALLVRASCFVARASCLAVVGQPLAGQTRDLVGTVRAAADDAARDGIGLWSACGGPDVPLG